MCQYLYASFSLKTGPEDGLTAQQAEATGRWRKVLTGIAVEEMLHLALVANLMTAIGAAPMLSRPNFPRQSEYLPPGVQFAHARVGRHQRWAGSDVVHLGGRPGAQHLDRTREVQQGELVVHDEGEFTRMPPAD
jgi:hypothetical protein